MLKNKAIRFLFALSLTVTVITTFFANNANANPRYASLVIDADTGVVIHQENAGKLRYPASLVKMMTVYMTFQAIESGKLSFNKKIRVSSRAAGQPPSKIGLRRGEYIKVKDALLAVIIKSANDAAVVLAEAIGGSEWQFAIMMNRMAKRLGMENTTYRNASGLHNRAQKTTAYDMAKLAVALRRDYPSHYHLFDRTKFFYNGRVYKTHNRVAKDYRGADGLKTGYIRAAGYNLVTSARRNGKSIVAVVLGGRSSKRRDRHMVKLLDDSFYKLANGNIGSGNKLVYTGVNAPTPSLKPRPKAQAKVNESIPTPETKPDASAKSVRPADTLIVPVLKTADNRNY